MKSINVRQDELANHAIEVADDAQRLDVLVRRRITASIRRDEQGEVFTLGLVGQSLLNGVHGLEQHSTACETRMVHFFGR